MLGDWQSASTVHDVLHAFVAHTYGVQGAFVTVWQTPIPLHSRAGVTVVELMQLATTQTVPWPYWRQAPAPLQLPSVPQLPAPWSAHWVVGTGSWPAAMLVHVPGVPASAHDLHVAVHAVAQQTPCAQMPLAQSVSAAHEAPLGRLVQTPLMQMFGATQSASAVQFVRQALPLQT
jgi:hypothetical protein